VVATIARRGLPVEPASAGGSDPRSRGEPPPLLLRGVPDGGGRVHALWPGPALLRGAVPWRSAAAKRARGRPALPAKRARCPQSRRSSAAPARVAEAPGDASGFPDRLHRGASLVAGGDGRLRHDPGEPWWINGRGSSLRRRCALQLLQPAVRTLHAHGLSPATGPTLALAHGAPL